MNKGNQNIDQDTIDKLGLSLTDRHVNADFAADARVFVYPHIDNVFIMESDLYGNKMPKNSCFLAFYGRNGLVGKHLNVHELKKMTPQEIKDMVKNNSEG